MADSIRLPFSAEDQRRLGDLQAAAKTLKQELKQVERELVAAAKAGVNASDSLVGRATALRGQLGSVQAQMQQQKAMQAIAAASRGQSKAGPGATISFGDVRDIGRAASNALAGNWGAVVGDAIQEAKKGKNGLLRRLIPSQVGGSALALGGAAHVLQAAVSTAEEMASDATQSFESAHKVAAALRGLPRGKPRYGDMEELIKSNMATRGYSDITIDGRATVARFTDKLTMGLVGNIASGLDMLVDAALGKSLGAKAGWDSWKKNVTDEKADATTNILKKIEEAEKGYAAAAKAEAVFNVKEAQKQLRKANAALPEKYQFWYDPEKRIMAQEGARIASRQFARSMMSRGSDRTGD